MDRDNELRKLAALPNRTGKVNIQLWAERWAYKTNRPLDEILNTALVQGVEETDRQS